MTGLLFEPEQIIPVEDTLRLRTKGWGEQALIEKLQHYLEVSLGEVDMWADRDDLSQVTSWAEETTQIYYSLMLHMRILGFDEQFYVYRKHYTNWKRFVDQLYRNFTFRMMDEVIEPWEPQDRGLTLPPEWETTSAAYHLANGEE